MIRAILIVITLVFYSLHILGQQIDVNGTTKRQIAESMIKVGGIVDDNILATLYHTQSEDCSGILYINGDVQIPFEGTCSESHISLLEFDDRAKVVSKLAGEINHQGYQLDWKDNLTGVVKSFYGSINKIHQLAIRQYQNVAGQQILLWSDKQQLKLPKQHLDSWSTYTCNGAPYACTSADGHQLSISDKTVHVNGTPYRLNNHLQLATKTHVTDAYHYNFIYPILGSTKFDTYITGVIQEKIKKFESQLSNESEGRFEQELLGDISITLFSDDLISGYLKILSSKEAKLETIPFTYDRDANEFLGIRDIWKDDFNYSYFLKTRINKERRILTQKEETVLRPLMKDVPFSHFMLSDQGILLLTDHNTIYGRRSIHIPYVDIRSLIDVKSLSKHIANTIPS